MLDATIGNYDYLSKTVSKWIIEESNNKFNNLDDLIEHFNPYPNSLGHSGRHGYTANFESEYFRVRNAFDQTVKLTENDMLMINNFEKSNMSWRAFFKNLKKNNGWAFVDLLTGEIFSKRDILDGKFGFHHIDSDKSNDDNDNLCFLLPHNHGIITVAQIYHPILASFFEDILTHNFLTLKSGKLPHSWKVGWRNLTIKEGIKLPRRKYRMKIKNKTIIKQALNKRDLNNWL